ncbi:MAG: hypothetical protein ACYCQI_14075 [Gammaproteobacteria bacterium]
MQTRDYIIYNYFGLRKMVVIDGQPYYQSTGQSSKNKNIWFPFIILKGSQSLNYFNLPSYLEPLFIKKEADLHHSTYIVKLLQDYWSDKSQQVFFNLLPSTKNKELISRIPTKQMLITASRLSGKDFPEAFLVAAKLDEKQMALAKTPIQLTQHPVFSSSNPDKINQWLVSQGASCAKRLLTPKRSPALFQGNEAQESKKGIPVITSEYRV